MNSSNAIPEDIIKIQKKRGLDFSTFFLMKTAAEEIVKTLDT